MRFEAMRRRALPALAAMLMLAACQTTVFDSSGDEPTTAPPPCPRISVLEDAGFLTRFQGAGRDVTDVVFEAEMQPPRSACVYRDNAEIVISMVVPIVIARGPANEAGNAQFNYFVAISRNGQVLVRQRFDVAISFEGNETRLGYVDELEQTIPLQPNENGSAYQVYVGIELTPAEIDFNRQR